MKTEVKNESNVVKLEAPSVIAFRSVQEFTLFRASMKSVITDKAKQNDAKVETAIQTLFDSYYAIDDAKRTLAVSVFNFCELTGAKYDEVSRALSKGLQNQLTASWVSKLYAAGRVLTLCPLTRSIADIEKLAMFNKLSEADLATALTEVNGIVMLDNKPIQLMNRSEVKAGLANLYPTVFAQALAAQSVWNIGNFKKSLDVARKNSAIYPEVQAAIEACIKVVDARIALLDADKKSLPEGTIKAS